MTHTPRRLIVGVSGASGVVIAVRLLQALRTTDVETHLIMTAAAELTLAHETELTPRDVQALADVVHANKNIGASVASGSFRTLGMVVAPCSMRSLAEIAGGATASLLTRAADVCLKERRRLVLAARETPLHLGHLRAMVAATEIGAIIMPPAPAFYAKPRSLEDMIDHFVGRLLDQFEIEPDPPLTRRWGEPAPTQ